MITPKCLPVYLVIDTSASMRPHLDRLNEELVNLFETLIDSPRLSEFAHLSIISFNVAPHMVLPMVDVQEVRALPIFDCGGVANFGPAFRMVRESIDVDVVALSKAGKAALRPVVIFLSGGQPDDDTWLEGLARLHDSSWRRRPHTVSYGLGTADEPTLRKIANRTVIVRKPTDLDSPLGHIFDSLLNTLVASAPAGELQISTEISGFTRIPIEYLE